MAEPAVDPDDATDRPSCVSRAYEFFGRRLRVDSQDPDVAEMLDALYDRQRIDPPADPDMRVWVGSAGPGGPRVELGGRSVRSPSAAQLAHHAHLVLVNAAAALAEDRRVIHAGAVVKEGRALILAGHSGWGKSTTSLALVQRGWRLLSDDFAVLRLDGTVEPFPRRVNLTADSLALLGIQAPPDAPRLVGFNGQVKWILEAEEIRPDSSAGPAPLAAVCLLAGPENPPEEELDSLVASEDPRGGPDVDRDRSDDSSAGDWLLELDHLPAALPAALAALEGVRAVETVAGEPPRLRLRAHAGARLVPGIDAVCAEHDVAVLSARRNESLRPLRPRFDRPPAMEPIDPETALMGLLVQDLSLSGRRFLSGTRPQEVLAASRQLRTLLEQRRPQLWRLSPGPLDATLDLLEERLAGGADAGASARFQAAPRPSPGGPVEVG